MLSAQKYMEMVRQSLTEHRLESGVPRNSYAPFGERRLETQVKLCAGRRLHNLTLRELTAPLSRRTWSMAFDEAHLLLHIEWVRTYFHFARPHMSLKRELANGQIRYLTPAVAAGVANRRYDVRELLMMSLYPETG